MRRCGVINSPNLRIFESPHFVFLGPGSRGKHSASPGTARKRAGFTLIELLVYMGIIGFILVTATSVTFEFAQARAKVGSLREANRNARLVLSRLVSEVREADGINGGGTTFGTNPGQLSLSFATTDPTRDPTIFSIVTDGSGRRTLYLQQGSGPNLPLTSPKVNMEEFVLTDLSTAVKTKTIAVHVKASYWTNDLLFAASAILDTTVQVKRADGFSN